MTPMTASSIWTTKKNSIIKTIVIRFVHICFPTKEGALSLLESGERNTTPVFVLHATLL